MSFDNKNDAVMKFSKNCEITCTSEKFAAFIAASDMGRGVSPSIGYGNGVENLAVADLGAGIGR